MRITKKNGMRDSIVKEKNHSYILRWGISIATVGVLMGIIWFFNPIQFEGNDDVGIMVYLAGFATGTPEVMPYLCNYLYGKLISNLYIWNPNIPWYVLMFLIVWTFSLITICNSFLRVLKTKKSYIIGIVFFVAVFFSFYFYSAVNLQYTTVAAICGAASISVYYTHEKGASKIEEIIDVIVASVLLFFAINIRSDVGYIVLVILISSVLLKVIKKEIERGFLLVLILSALMVTTVSFVSDSVYEKQNGWDKYIEYNAERSRYMDYPHLYITEAADIYASIGWDERVQNLVSVWCYFDENVTKGAFETLNEAYENRHEVDIISEVYSAMKTIIFQETTFKVLFICVLLLSVQVFVTYWLTKYTEMNTEYKKELGKNIISCIAFLAGTTCLFIYFAYTGRLIKRIINMVVILGLTQYGFSYLAFSKLQIDIVNNFKICAKKKFFLCEVIISGILIACLVSEGIASVTDRGIYSYEKRKEIEQYVIANQENFYIYDFNLATTADPFQIYPNEKPYNYMFWGGWSEKSPLYYKQLNANGYEGINKETLFDERMYFMGKLECADMLVSYVQGEYPEAYFEVVGEVEGYSVYKLYKYK